MAGKAARLETAASRKRKLDGEPCPSSEHAACVCLCMSDLALPLPTCGDLIGALAFTMLWMAD